MNEADRLSLEEVLRRGPQPLTDNSRLIGYARVSTRDQNLDMQIDALRKFGVHEDDLFAEKVSGVSQRRPQFEAAIRQLREGDTFVVWKLDRLGRSMAEILNRVEWFTKNGIRFRSLHDNLDLQTLGNRILLLLLAMMAEIEREMTIDRTKAGVRRYQERGGIMGAPPKLDDETKRTIAEPMFELGLSVKAVAEACDVSPQTIRNHYPEAKRTALLRRGRRKKVDAKMKPKPRKRRK